MRRISAEEYRAAFQLDDCDHDGVASHALQVALEIRKFEIELYWERAKYFWTFIAAALAAFAVVQKLDDERVTTFLSIVCSCLGVVLSFAWYLVNRGSKFWQENWENHVALLEDKFNGPLMKTVLVKETSSPLIGAGRYSVSRINLIVSLVVTLFWAFLVWYSCPRPFVYSLSAIDPGLATPIALAAMALIWLLRGGRSDHWANKGPVTGPKVGTDQQLSALLYESKIDPERPE